jgi:hypothetical protein
MKRLTFPAVFSSPPLGGGLIERIQCEIESDSNFDPLSINMHRIEIVKEIPARS